MIKFVMYMIEHGKAVDHEELRETVKLFRNSGRTH